MPRDEADCICRPCIHSASNNILSSAMQSQRRKADCQPPAASNKQLGLPSRAHVHILMMHVQLVARAGSISTLARSLPVPATPPFCCNPPWRCAGGSTVTVVEGQGRKAPEPVVTRSPAVFDTPLTVLINGRSASASEVLAGALKDNCRAVLVGDRQALNPNPKPQISHPRP